MVDDRIREEENMKTCPGCPTPAKCKAAGQCMKSAKMYGGGMAKKGYAKGGKAFPDLNKDGKVTKADILKGRGVKGFNKGGYAKCGASNPPAKKR